MPDLTIPCLLCKHLEFDPSDILKAAHDTSIRIPVKCGKRILRSQRHPITFLKLLPTDNIAIANMATRIKYCKYRERKNNE